VELRHRAHFTARADAGKPRMRSNVSANRAVSATWTTNARVPGYIDSKPRRPRSRTARKRSSRARVRSGSAVLGARIGAGRGSPRRPSFDRKTADAPLKVDQGGLGRRHNGTSKSEADDSATATHFHCAIAGSKLNDRCRVDPIVQAATSARAFSPDHLRRLSEGAQKARRMRLRSAKPVCER